MPILMSRSMTNWMEHLVQQVAPGSGICTYLELDNKLPNLLNEKQLLGGHWYFSRCQGGSKSANETTLLKSFKDILDSVQNISAFLIQRREFKVANEFSLLGDKVGEVAIQRRRTQS